MGEKGEKKRVMWCVFGSGVWWRKRKERKIEGKRLEEKWVEEEEK